MTRARYNSTPPVVNDTGWTDLQVTVDGYLKVAVQSAQNANGRAADASSTPVALSNEDVAILGIVTEAAPATDTASSGLNGRLQRIAQRLTSLINAFSNSFTNITTSTTTTVKSGAGSLKGVTVNTKGTIASTITIYDNTAGSGTKIGTIDSLNLTGQFVFDIAFATGLTLVTTGTVAPDITVSYR